MSRCFRNHLLGRRRRVRGRCHLKAGGSPSTAAAPYPNAIFTNGAGGITLPTTILGYAFDNYGGGVTGSYPSVPAIALSVGYTWY
jgi:hypothetical protein